ncbi:MAG: permease-like cell division protein FtsX [Defluviitaleaceae bacterium]|nr:permease-like cell division protein FtsX [Defluviitaleaceae bacterium]
MKPRTIRYYFREAFRSVIRNRLMSVASIFTVASCIMIVSVFYILAVHFEFFVRQMEETVGMVVFVDEELTMSDIVELQGMIQNIPQVANLEFIHRDDALADFRELIGEDSRILMGLEDYSPFRHSFAVELTSLAFEEDVYIALQNLEHAGVAFVRRPSDLGPILLMMSSMVQIISISLIVVLGFISVIIITNTIRITVNARQTEINIMKYVGATDWFIRWPFVIEGALVGMIGGFVPSVVIWLTYGRTAAAVGGIPELQFIELIPSDEIFTTLLPFAVLLGTIIGLAGSITAVRRHLKV